MKTLCSSRTRNRSTLMRMAGSLKKKPEQSNSLLLSNFLVYCRYQDTCNSSEMDSFSEKISTNTARNTPITIPCVPFRDKLIAKYNEQNPLSNIEKRILKIEDLIHISEQMNELKSKQDELTLNEINRRMNDFENRLGILESANSHLIVNVQDKLEQHEVLLTSAQNITELRKELEEITSSSFSTGKIAALEREMNEKMLGICEAMGELAQKVSEKDKILCQLREELKSPESNLLDKVGALLGIPETHSDSDESSLTLICNYPS